MCECDELFAEFGRCPLGSVERDVLAARSGVYILKLLSKGRDIEVAKLERRVNELGIRYVTDRMWPGVRRNLDEVLHSIQSCPVLYIGATGLKKNAKANLRTRLDDLFTGKHVIMPTLWLLLVQGWKLDYLHHPCAMPREVENSLIDRYKGIHDTIPPLNRRG